MRATPSLTRHAPGRAAARPWIAEHSLRLGAGVVLLLLQFEAMLGLHWDIQWHISVGRDRFWTPPHVLLYTSVGLRGLLCVGVVLWETWRYRRAAGPDDGNSIAVLGVFHAPLGFVVAGFGALVTALAAPLDDYWHQLYGIDVELWAPFHMMGSLGGLIAGLGSVYVWAALTAQARGAARAAPRWTAEALGLAVAFTFLLGQMIVLAWPAQLRTPAVGAGGVAVMLYPALLGLGLPWLLVAATDTLGLRRAALAVAAVFLLRDGILQAFVPWAVRAGAAAEGFPFRSPVLVPRFQIAPLVFDVGLLLIALLADRLARGSGRPGRAPARASSPPAGAGPAWLRGAVLGLPLYGLAVAAALWERANLPPGGLPAELALGAPADGLAMALALPVTVALAAGSGWLGGGLSRVWRWSRR